MSYIHLTISERSKIETYLELGYSIRQIAERLKRSPFYHFKRVRAACKLFA